MVGSSNLFQQSIELVNELRAVSIKNQLLLKEAK